MWNAGIGALRSGASDCRGPMACCLHIVTFSSSQERHFTVLAKPGGRYLTTDVDDDFCTYLTAACDGQSGMTFAIVDRIRCSISRSVLMN